MPEITINGDVVEVEEGELLFEVIKDQGIEVPHFCYHPELSLAGACRMCMVEIDGTIDISCTRRVEDGMEVVTDNEEVADERRSILEFLLLNHPLDCPVCDKGGECPLQDYTMGYGPAESRFHGNKRTFPKFDLGELLTQRQNRCILCYRCTRFYQEEGGREDFRVIERGNDAFVGKQPGGQLESELSGNMIDICPTGTIVSQPYLHKSRPWEQEPVESIAGMDPLQTPITADVRGDEITRIRPQEDPDFPKPWIDDRVRFVHEYNHEDNRVELPADETFFGRHDDVRETLEDYDSDEVAGFISPDRTTEEQHLFKKYFNENLESDQVAPVPGVGQTAVDPARLEDLLEADFVLVAGTNFREEYPMLTPFLRTASRNGAFLAYLSYWGEKLTIDPDVYMQDGPEELLERLDRLRDGNAEDRTDEALLEQLSEAEKTVVVTCEGRTLGHELTDRVLEWNEACDYLRLSPGGNSKTSELLFGENDDARELLERARDGEIKALFTYGLNLLRDFPDRTLVREALDELDYLAVADYLNNSVTEQADEVLPLTTQFEEPGLLINAEGRIRQRPAVTDHDERILSGWENLNFLVNPDADYPDPNQILDELKDTVEPLPEDLDRNQVAEESGWLEAFDHRVDDASTTPEGVGSGDWVIFSEPRLFSGDRRAQASPSVEGMIQPSQIECHEDDAPELGADRRTELNLSINGDTINREVQITNEAPSGTLFLPWNGEADKDLSLYHSERTYERVQVQADADEDEES
jgi:NADH-quinone oxidoreductase subunit G